MFKSYLINRLSPSMLQLTVFIRAWQRLVWHFGSKNTLPTSISIKKKKKCFKLSRFSWIPDKLNLCKKFATNVGWDSKMSTQLYCVDS